MKYDEKNVANSEQMKFIDDTIDEVFKPAKEETFDLVSKIMLLGIMLGIYSKVNEDPDKLRKIPELKWSRFQLIGKDELTPQQSVILHIRQAIPLKPHQEKLLQLAEQNIGIYITNISDTVRKEVKGEIIRAYMEKKHPRQLSHELYKKFDGLKKNWRLIAVTETATMAITGFLSTLQEGDKIKGYSLPGACDECRRFVDSKIFIFTNNPPVSSNDPMQKTHVWIGKSNFGRKRADWFPCLPLHPGERCMWIKV